MMHIVWIIANNSSAPYFNWFAERVSLDSSIRLSFINLFHEKPKMIEEVGKWGCKCYWIKYGTNSKKLETLKVVPKLFKLFRKLKPDVVNTHLFEDSLSSLLAAKLAGIKKRVITKGDTGFHYFFVPKYILLDKFNNWNASHIIAISNESKNFILDKEKANPIKVHLIHHGVPLNQITKINEDIKSKFIDKFNLQNKIIIGTISRFIEWKGHKFIIDAAEKIIKKYPQCIFIFVGSGGIEHKLNEIILQKKLNKNIIVTGWIAPNEIHSLYGLFNIFVHAAKHEPFGFVIAEALFHGIPVVSTKTGAAADSIKHLENGYLCDYDSSEQIEKGIEYFLNLAEKDKQLIRENSKKTAKELFSFERMFNNYMNLYGRE